MTNRIEPPEDVGGEPIPAKQALRRAVLAARQEIPAVVRATADAALGRVAAAAVAGRSTVAAYVPMRGEPGGPALLAALAPVVPRLLLPVLLPDLDLDWAVYHGELERPGPAGFRAPTGARLGVDAIGEADLVLVPALAVGRDGGRLGRGGGSYDRALARVSTGTPVLALLYPGELRESVPTAGHDRRVSGVVLPTGTELLS